MRVPNKKEYYVADFETTSKVQYDIEGSTRVYLWYIENIYVDSDNALGMTISQFHRWITRESDTSINRIIFFHNLSFDILFYEYFLNSIGFRNVEEHPADLEYTTIRDGMRQVYSLQFTIDNITIEFRDSLKLLQSSVDRLPNLRGIDKLEFDYDIVRNEKSLSDFKPEELQYVKHDVWKVKDVLQALLVDLGDYLTIASSSYNDWYKRYIRDDKWKYKNDFPIIDPDDEILIRRAYNGGIVVLNPEHRGKLLEENIVKFDENSEYPAKMRYEMLPYGRPERIIFKGNMGALIRRKYNLFIYQVNVRKMTIKEGYHPFISRTKNYTFAKKEDFPHEIIDTVFQWTNIDLDDALMYYDMDYEIIYENSFAMKSKDDTFTEYIDYYYNLKENAKNDFEYLFSKFRLNTLYGKFGTNKERLSLITNYINEEIDFEVVDSESKKEYYLPIAVFITSYARHDLITQIQNEREGFIYADTDSIHVFEKHLKMEMKLDPKKLGYWDNEGTAVKSVYINNKQYINEMDNGKIVRRIASLSRDNHNKVNFDNMHIGSTIINGKKMKKHVKGGYIIVSTDFTFK